MTDFKTVFWTPVMIYIKKDGKEHMPKHSECSFINLPNIEDSRGNLTVIEELSEIPFEIARTYWIYDVPGGEIRGSHAFKEQHEIIVALSGSFDVITHDGKNENRTSLNRSYYGLYLPPMTWRTIENFSTNAVCLVLSSHEFSESDYIRSFDEFITVRANSTSPSIVNIGRERVSDQCCKPTIYDAAIIELPRVGGRNGHISIVEGKRDLPFDVRRVFSLFDIPAGESRGAHAHYECHQFLIAVSGSFEVMIDDGRNKRSVVLDRPYYGLHIPPGLWAAEYSFSGGAICLVLASHGYSEADYIRDYYTFLESKK